MEINQNHEKKIKHLENMLSQVEKQCDDLKQEQVKKQLEKSASITTVKHMKRKSLPVIYESVSPVKTTRTKMEMSNMTVSRNTARDYAQSVMLT